MRMKFENVEHSFRSNMSLIRWATLYKIILKHPTLLSFLKRVLMGQAYMRLQGANFGSRFMGSGLKLGLLFLAYNLMTRACALHAKA